MPFSALGFIGLSQHLGINRFFSRLGLAFMLFGLVAAMLAAAVNGLTLPFFISDYAEANQATIAAIKPILRYNMAFNHSFDYLLIGAMFLSMFLWSISIFRSGRLPRWLAYLGFTIVAVVVGAGVSGFYFLDLHGFRMFVFGWLVWIVATAVSLWSASEETV
ncbi:MAG: hypothetical protein AB8H12_05620 [Lewinella sp.]